MSSLLLIIICSVLSRQYVPYSFLSESPKTLSNSSISTSSRPNISVSSRGLASKRSIKTKKLFMVTIHIAYIQSVLCYVIPGMLLNMNREDPQIPDFIGLGSRFGFNAPILGIILRLWGCNTVYKENLRSLMLQRKNVALVPGGYEEATLTTPKQMRFYIKNRKGFIKYALQYGYTMRPVLCIGQNKAFQTFDSLKSLRLLLNKLKLPTVFFINWKYLCFMDPNIELTTIVGKGIKKENADPDHQPSIQEIDHYHKLYVEQLTRLYNKYKHLNGNKPLVIM